MLFRAPKPGWWFLGKCENFISCLNAGVARPTSVGFLIFFFQMNTESAASQVPLGLCKLMYKRCLNKGLHKSKVWLRGGGRADQREEGTGKGTKGFKRQWCDFSPWLRLWSPPSLFSPLAQRGFLTLFQSHMNH